MKSALLSKIAMCVCPPAIVATSAVTVPPVKRAVHRLTAPAHAPAKPKPRHVFSAAYDCTPTAVPLSSGPSAMTVVAPTDSTGDNPVKALAVRDDMPPPENFPPVNLPQPPYPGPLIFAPGVPPAGPVSVTPTPPAAVPELSTWAMTITGFGAIGWAMRRKGRATDAAVETA